MKVLTSIIVIVVAALAHTYRSHLLPHGPAVAIPPHHRPAISHVDPSNISLRLSSGKLTKIYERRSSSSEDDGGPPPLLVHPETIIFDNHGKMYIMNEYAKLISLTDFEPAAGEESSSSPITMMTAKATEVADLGVGRPLGGKFDYNNDCLYFADAILGLARICNLPAADDDDDNEMNKSSPSAKQKKPNNNVELLASRVRLEDGTWSPINYADDLDIGPRTGHVYFSDASDVKSDRDVILGLWDYMYASKVEGVRGKRTGRLLRYKPETGEVHILVTGVAFANGVAVNKDETYVLYSSTFEGSVMKYPINDDDDDDVEEGRAKPERILDHFPGFLDGVDCSFQSGLCYVAIATPLDPLIGAIFAMPTWIGRPIRTLLMMLPKALAPKVKQYGAAAEINPGDENTPARIIRIFQDPDGRDISTVTGVTEYDGKLYLGSLHGNYVGVVSLE